MPPDSVTEPNYNIISRELYDLILRVATVPVLIFLIGLSWFIINRLMSPQSRQARRTREIRKAVAARQARLAASASEKIASDEPKPLSPGE